VKRKRWEERGKGKKVKKKRKGRRMDNQNKE
jgi:hypothetical protein